MLQRLHLAHSTDHRLVALVVNSHSLRVWSHEQGDAQGEHASLLPSTLEFKTGHAEILGLSFTSPHTLLCVHANGIVQAWSLASDASEDALERARRVTPPVASHRLGCGTFIDRLGDPSVTAAAPGATLCWEVALGVRLKSADFALHPETGTLYAAFGGVAGQVIWMSLSPAFFIMTRQLGHLQSCVNLTRLSAQGTLLATSCRDHSVAVWRPLQDPDGDPWRLFQESRAEIWALVFSHSSRYLAGGGVDHGVYLWELDADSPLRAHRRDHSGWISDLAWSDHDRVLASASWDNSVGVYRGADLMPLYRLDLHTDYVSGVAFIPETTLLVSASYDRKIAVWDWSQAALVRVFDEHRDWVQALLPCSNGTFLSASSDRHVHLWSSSPLALSVEMVEGSTRSEPRASLHSSMAQLPAMAIRADASSHDIHAALQHALQSSALHPETTPSSVLDASSSPTEQRFKRIEGLSDASSSLPLAPNLELALPGEPDIAHHDLVDDSLAHRIEGASLTRGRLRSPRRVEESGVHNLQEMSLAVDAVDVFNLMGSQARAIVILPPEHHDDSSHLPDPPSQSSEPSNEISRDMLKMLFRRHLDSEAVESPTQLDEAISQSLPERSPEEITQSLFDDLTEVFEDSLHHYLQVKHDSQATSIERHEPSDDTRSTLSDGEHSTALQQLLVMEQSLAEQSLARSPGSDISAPVEATNPAPELEDVAEELPEEEESASADSAASIIPSSVSFGAQEFLATVPGVGEEVDASVRVLPRDEFTTLADFLSSQSSASPPVDDSPASSAPTLADPYPREEHLSLATIQSTTTQDIAEQALVQDVFDDVFASLDSAFASGGSMALDNDPSHLMSSSQPVEDSEALDEEDDDDDSDVFTGRAFPGTMHEMHEPEEEDDLPSADDAPTMAGSAHPPSLDSSSISPALAILMAQEESEAWYVNAIPVMSSERTVPEDSGEDVAFPSMGDVPTPHDEKRIHTSSAGHPVPSYLDEEDSSSDSVNQTQVARPHPNAETNAGLFSRDENEHSGAAPFMGRPATASNEDLGYVSANTTSFGGIVYRPEVQDEPALGGNEITADAFPEGISEAISQSEFISHTPEWDMVEVSELWQLRHRASQSAMKIFKRRASVSRQSWQRQHPIRAELHNVFASSSRSDSEYFAAGGATRHLSVWNFHGELIYQLPATGRIIYALTATPDGRILVSGDDKAHLDLWLIDFDQHGHGVPRLKRARLDGHTAPISHLATNSSGRLLLSAGLDGTARLWNLEDGSCVSVLDHSGESLSSCDFWGAGLVSVSLEGVLRLWDRRGIQIDLVEGFAPLTCVAARRHKIFFGTRSGEIYCYERGQTRQIGSHDAEVAGMSLHVDGTLITASRDCTIKIHYEDGQQALTLQANAPLTCIDLDGSRIIAGTEGGDLEFFKQS